MAEDLIDEKARTDIANVRVELAEAKTRLEGGVERAVEVGEQTLERVVRMDKKLDGVCQKVDRHEVALRVMKWVGTTLGLGFIGLAFEELKSRFFGR